jgi:hypothetical protein
MAYLGQNSLEPDIAIGVFFLDPPRAGEDGPGHGED